MISFDPLKVATELWSNLEQIN